VLLTKKLKIMNDEIITAIENQNVLEFYYKGHLRIVEPHAFGVTIKGNEILRAYQIDGTSDSGDVPDWRLFSTNKIEQLTTRTETFSGTRSGYTPADSAMDEIYCEI
jgi:predicted DNA-binding transcriptional regulator YafY